ncbi:MAG: hypothetical protein R2776_06365 [Flavobacteriaceae bacterium]
MASIVDLWKTNKDFFERKSVQQILTFSGEGKLKDNNSTSFEFRQLLEIIPSEMLINFANDCLVESFNDSGLVLQDLINEIGTRLGFDVEPGLYRGKKNDIGFDGIWTSNSGHKIILEVKTTDAYRINLDTVSNYRENLIEEKRVKKSESSILIVVGRQDTGDLEAQIRGSRHAWDIRLISTDSLIKLLNLRENLSDTKTLQQINEVLKPLEYTRIDKLIDLIFLTSKDVKLEEEPEEEIQTVVKTKSSKEHIDEKKFKPVNFYLACVENISKILDLNFVKHSKISFATKDKSTGLICAISKEHIQGKNQKYWFAFHPHQNDFLQGFDNSYVGYGCGNANQVFLIPFKIFKTLVPNMWTTEKEDRMYWHVVIHKRDNKFLLQQPKNDIENLLDITKYKI